LTFLIEGVYYGELIKLGYNPIILPYHVRYFRMSERDLAYPNDRYFESLKDIIMVALRYKPLLVHCFIGQHRSPIVALMAAIIDSKDYSMENYESTLAKILQLRKECAEILHFNFTQSAQSWMKKNIIHSKINISNKLEEIQKQIIIS